MQKISKTGNQYSEILDKVAQEFFPKGTNLYENSEPKFRQVDHSDGRGPEKSIPINGVYIDKMREVFGKDPIASQDGSDKWFFEVLETGDIFDIFISTGSLYLNVPWEKSRKNRNFNLSPKEYIKPLMDWIGTKTGSKNINHIRYDGSKKTIDDYFNYSF